MRLQADLRVGEFGEETMLRCVELLEDVCGFEEEAGHVTWLQARNFRHIIHFLDILANQTFEA